jgi:hypothetical protein
LAVAVETDADSLRLRANVTILEGLYSENISMSAAMQRAGLWTRIPRLRWEMPIKGERMKLSRWIAKPHLLLAGRAGLAEGRLGQSGEKPVGAKFLRAMLILRAMLLVPVIAALAAMPVPAMSQSLLPSEDPSAISGITAPQKLDRTYVRPTERTKVSNYAFDAFGPYPVAGATFAAGINQWSNAPPEWNQGAEGFGKRFGSDFAIAAIGTTTRYGLAEAFKEDTLYYRCECAGPLPRLRHAVISTFTGRRSENGHRVFSISALAAPYTGSVVAVYVWYPDRFGAKDAFRMGNYSLLSYMGGNIALEFFYSGPHSLISRMHLNNAHGSPDTGPKP